MGFGVLEWQFIVDKQYDTLLIFSLVRLECHTGDFPMNIVCIRGCPLKFHLEILVIWGKVNFIL